MQYLIQSFADVKRLEKYKWVKFELPVKGTGMFKTAFARCRHILKTVKNVTATKLELAFTRYRNNLKTVGTAKLVATL